MKGKERDTPLIGQLLPPALSTILFYLMFEHIPNIKYKTQFCRYWQEGKQCEKGVGCFFAHGEGELRKAEDNQQVILHQQTELRKMQGRPNNYKTISCKFYAEGECKLGDHCGYVHERRERRKKRQSGEWPVQEQANIHAWNNYYSYYSQFYQYQSYLPPQSFTQYSLQPQQDSPDTNKSDNPISTIDQIQPIANIGPYSSEEKEVESEKGDEKQA